jgi:hypothetical protein
MASISVETLCVTPIHGVHGFALFAGADWLALFSPKLQIDIAYQIGQWYKST